MKYLFFIMLFINNLLAEDITSLQCVAISEKKGNLITKIDMRTSVGRNGIYNILVSYNEYNAYITFKKDNLTGFNGGRLMFVFASDTDNNKNYLCKLDNTNLLLRISNETYDNNRKAVQLIVENHRAYLYKCRYIK